VLENRFSVRPVGASDGPLLYQIFAQPAVAEWHRAAGAQGPPSPEDCGRQAEIDAAHWLVHQFGPWLVLDGEVPVARGGLGQCILRRRAEVEIVWAVRQERWGEAIATDIGRAAWRWPVTGDRRRDGLHARRQHPLAPGDAPARPAPGGRVRPRGLAPRPVPQRLNGAGGTRAAGIT
jgi:GNAT acetyltransferase-like protein